MREDPSEETSEKTPMRKDPSEDVHEAALVRGHP